MPITKLPHLIPVGYKLNAGVLNATPDIDTGGYDVMIGGFGFRLATDTQFPYLRSTEATTVARFDVSNEPNEHSLSALPWIKDQSSFHGGAGQLNLEAPLSTFQYQEAHVEHLRFDTSLGVDVWTPGQVKRLPDTTIYNFGVAPTIMTTANVGGIDYAIVGGGPGVGLWQVAWLSGPDSAPTLTQINDGDYGTGGRGTTTMISICNDGTSYYAMLVMGAPNGFAVQVGVVKGTIGSTAAPVFWTWRPIVASWSGVVAYVKNRLILAEQDSTGSFIYEVDTTTSQVVTAYTPKYTAPNRNFTYRSVSESPTAILVAGDVGGFNSSILKFTLDSTGGTPTLSGGANIATFPTGEQVLDMMALSGSFLGIASNRGIRIASFDTYTGALKYGPLSPPTSQPVNALAGRDRFLFGSFTNQQADGKTGLLRVDASQLIDQAGRNAWSPDLRPPTSAPTGVGVVSDVNLLPAAGRLVFLTPEGIHVEGNGAGSDGNAWLRTSRIRFNTAEKKLFKLGAVNGTIDTSGIQITGTAPFASDVNLGTVGPISGGQPGEFRLPTGLNEWIQLKFSLIGSSCVMNGYYAKAYPAPKRQHLITVTVDCFRNEVDRGGIEAVDPLTPRQRLAAVQSLESAGNEVRFTEFTNTGAVSQLVVIDQLEFHSFSRPSQETDFGGYITFKLRTTEG